jgi:Abortive infection alpha
MRKRWANLLANAADPREQRPVVSSFVSALNDLSSRDARFLDALFANEMELKKTYGTVVYAEQDLWKLYARAGLGSYPDLAELLERENAGFSGEIENDARAIQFMIEILQKHLIIEKQREQIPVNADGVPVRAVVSQKTIVTLVSEDRYKVTEIGRRFLVACGPPVR